LLFRAVSKTRAIRDHSSLADLNEAAMRRTRSRVTEPTVEMI
jgi:hypothetical protein